MSEKILEKTNNVLQPQVSLLAAEHLLNRTRVTRLFKDSNKKPLTTVIAPAGYGKTQAVLSFLEGYSNNSKCCLLLTELDNHILRFWNRFIETLEIKNAILKERLLSIGLPVTPAVYDRFFELLEKYLDQPLHYFWVFDDLHLIHNESILHFIETLVLAHICNLSVILISRTKPNIGLSGMLSKRLLVRITEEDLRFTKDEISEYYKILGITFNDSILNSIYTSSDGWAFAIFLIGLAAEKGKFGENNPILSAKLDIFDLLNREVFSKLSEECQKFLIQIAILNDIPSELLKELATNNPSLLSEISELNAFIRFDPYSSNYSFHQLFKEFLLDKKYFEKQNSFHRTNLIAGEWFKKNNRYFEALYHFKEIGQYDEIFSIIISIPGQLPFEDANTLIELIESAPKERLENTPLIRVAKAGYLYNNNRLDDAEKELKELQKELESKLNYDIEVLGEVYLLLAVIALVHSDYSFIELFKKAYELLPNGSSLVDYRTGMAEGVNACSIKYPYLGELKKHQDALFEVAPYIERTMNGSGYGLEYLNASEASLYTGDLKAAEKYAYEAIYRSKKYLQYDIEYMAVFVLVRIYTSRGNYLKVSELLEEKRIQLETLVHEDIPYLFDMICGWFYTKIGRTDLIARWIIHQDDAKKILAPVVTGREYLVRSDSMLAEEKYYELLAFMEQTDSIYEARGILFATIQNLITKAIVHHYLRNYEESIKSLTKAYELSYPNNLTMQFIEYGNRMRTLVHSARQNENCTIDREWLDLIYTKSSSYAKMLSQLVASYSAVHNFDDKNDINLSSREHEILNHLYNGLTRKEMALGSYLSLSTVNSILNSVYNKLEASNATEAVRIAKEKGLI